MRVLSALMVVVGVAIVVRTLAAGGGARPRAPIICVDGQETPAADDAHEHHRAARRRPLPPERSERLNSLRRGERASSVALA
jgi:hypothetical protein